MLAVSREVYSLDANLPVPALMPLSDRLKRATAFDRNIAALLLAFGAIALLLASVGLYAAVARTVVARTREIGLRIAIGASRIDIWKFVFQTAQWPLTFGLCGGLIGAFAVNRLIQAALVGVSAADPFAFAVASAVLLLVAIVGCGIPARRAMRLDPTVALKQE
jgi:ABC-type antimicrobial peptide transport system permease subunit